MVTELHVFHPTQGPDELILLGLRTLEVWVDNFNPEYVDVAISEVSTHLGGDIGEEHCAPVPVQQVFCVSKGKLQQLVRSSIGLLC
jgi:hypothetical protein